MQQVPLAPPPTLGQPVPQVQQAQPPQAQQPAPQPPPPSSQALSAPWETAPWDTVTPAAMPEPSMPPPSLPAPGSPAPILPALSPLPEPEPMPAPPGPGMSVAGAGTAAPPAPPQPLTPAPAEPAAAPQAAPQAARPSPPPSPSGASSLLRHLPAAVRGRRAARKPRLAMSAVFADLVDMADIPRSAYAVDEEVTGAMCLFKTDGGYEVFSCAEDARHEVRFFEDEEAAYFYLFGVLAAEAVRHGRLSPRRG